jgi:exopolyphosphatase/guanosine-5'-triphosphate,3'-diphosphate pyrophosphatase
MRYAVIDIGSNSIRLHLYDVDAITGAPRPLFNKKTIAGLASFVEEGKMSPKGINRVVRVLTNYRELLRAVNIDQVFAFATAAIRKVSNADQVLEAIRSATGFEVDLISSETEALLGYNGLCSDCHLPDGLAVDIGGGSTELVGVEDFEIRWLHSLSEGTLSLFNTYVSDLFPTEKEIKAIDQSVKEELRLLAPPPVPSGIMVGSGGTMRAAGNVSQEYFRLGSNRVLEYGHIHKLYRLFRKRDRELLRLLIQVVPERIHTFGPGLVLLRTVCKFFSIQKILISNQGVREGYLLSKLQNSAGAVKMGPVAEKGGTLP